MTPAIENVLMEENGPFMQQSQYVAANDLTM